MLFLFPPFSALYQLNLVKAEIARAFIPKEFRLVEAFGYILNCFPTKDVLCQSLTLLIQIALSGICRYTLGGFFLANYGDSPAGTFDEVFCLLLNCFPKLTLFHASLDNGYWYFYACFKRGSKYIVRAYFFFHNRMKKMLLYLLYFLLCNIGTSLLFSWWWLVELFGIPPHLARKFRVPPTSLLKFWLFCSTSW